MTDPSDPRLVRPCQRIRAGKAPDPVPFPADPWTRTDAGRAAAHDRRAEAAAAANDEAAAPRTNPLAIPRRRDAGPSPVFLLLAGMVVLCLIVPLAVHLWRGVGQ